MFDFWQRNQSQEPRQRPSDLHLQSWALLHGSSGPSKATHWPLQSSPHFRDQAGCPGTGPMTHLSLELARTFLTCLATSTSEMPPHHLTVPPPPPPATLALTKPLQLPVACGLRVSRGSRAADQHPPSRISAQRGRDTPPCKAPGGQLAMTAACKGRAARGLHAPWPHPALSAAQTPGSQRAKPF